MNFKEELALKRKQLAEAEQQKEVIKPIVVKEEMPIKPNEVIKLIKFPKKSKLAIPNEELIEEPVKEGKYNATSDQLYLAYYLLFGHTIRGKKEYIKAEIKRQINIL